MKRDTELVAVDPERPAHAAIERAALVLRSGGLVAFPTETVYGLGANALDAQAVERIFAAKGRPASDPLIVHLASADQLPLVVQSAPELAWRLAEAFWPGPLTLVLARHPRVPANVSAGLDTVAVRVPRHPVALALLRAAGVPVAAPSANRFARPSPTAAQHVLDDLGGAVDLVIDGGQAVIGLESTVLSLAGPTPLVLRPGGVPIEALRALLPDVVFAPSYLDDAAGAAAPGQLLRHYSPAAELLLFAGPLEPVLSRMRQAAVEQAGRGRLVGVLAPDEERDRFASTGAQVVSLGARDDLAQVGARLFAAMRALETAGAQVILVRAFDREGLGLAIWDRLIRATEGRVIEVDSEPG